MKAPPTNTENIVFQLAIPVHNSRMAPRAMAITLVSPMEPGIRPVTMSQENSGTAPEVAAAPNGVATVRPVSYTHLDVYKRQIQHRSQRTLLAG